MKEKITQEELKKHLHYNPLTGLFINKETRQGQAKKGCVAGSLSKEGYVKIVVSGKVEYAQRLAWLYVHGYLPELEMDHLDRVKHHNWIDNLREVSRQCNNRNRTLNKNNKTGVTGVQETTGLKPYQVYIGVDGVKTYIGCFKNFGKAVYARWKAEVKYNYPNCNTTSTAYEYLKKHNLLDKE